MRVSEDCAYPMPESARRRLCEKMRKEMGVDVGIDPVQLGAATQFEAEIARSGAQINANARRQFVEIEIVDDLLGKRRIYRRKHPAPHGDHTFRSLLCKPFMVRRAQRRRNSLMRDQQQRQDRNT